MDNKIKAGNIILDIFNQKYIYTDKGEFVNLTTGETFEDQQITVKQIIK